MLIRIQQDDFDATAVSSEMRKESADIGAVVNFIGCVRDQAPGGVTIKSLTLEHYPGMTEKALEAIAQEALSRWSLIDVAIIHRVGRLEPQDQIVLVVVAAEHRGAAFQACEFIMDYLKTRAPFWKKEETSEGTHWVEARDTDSAAADRW